MCVDMWPCPANRGLIPFELVDYDLVPVLTDQRRGIAKLDILSGTCTVDRGRRVSHVYAVWARHNMWSCVYRECDVRWSEMVHEAVTSRCDPPACATHTSVRLHGASRMPSRRSRGALAGRPSVPRWAPAGPASCVWQRYDEAQLGPWPHTMNTLSRWDSTYDKPRAHSGRLSYASGPHAKHNASSSCGR